MGYELDRLMANYGVGLPTLTPYTGDPANTEDQQQYDSYKQEYLRRVAALRVYNMLYGGAQSLSPLQLPTYASPTPTPTAVDSAASVSGPTAASPLYSPGESFSGFGGGESGFGGGESGLGGFSSVGVTGAEAASADSGIGGGPGVGGIGEGAAVGVDGPGPSGGVGPGSSGGPDGTGGGAGGAGTGSGDSGSAGDSSSGSADGSARARGGRVRRFALGGLNEADQREDFAGLAERYGAQLPQEPAPTAAAAPAAQQTAGLDSMLAKYLQPAAGGMNYGQELAAARKTARTETDAFQKLLKQAIAQPDQPPSKSELYFRLAAAFADPGKTGSFGEGLGRAAGAVAEQKKAEREAAKASAAQKLQLGLTAQQAKMQAAKEDVGTLRTLAAEDEKSKRAVTSELLKEWVKKNDPVSTAGKQAQDEGLQPGTPEFQRRVKEISELSIEKQVAAINATVAQIGVAAAQLTLAQKKDVRAEEASKKLTPAEVKLKTETEDTLAAADSAIGMLERAYALNPNTFDASLPDQAQRKVLEAAGSKDKKLLNTRELENLLGEQALAKLKATFGGAPTEGERQALLDLQGLGAKSIQERAQVMKNIFRVLRDNRARQRKRLNDINAGLYRDVSGQQPSPLE